MYNKKEDLKWFKYLIELNELETTDIKNDNINEFITFLFNNLFKNYMVTNWNRIVLNINNLKLKYTIIAYLNSDDVSYFNSINSSNIKEFISFMISINKKAGISNFNTHKDIITWVYKFKEHNKENYNERFILNLAEEVVFYFDYNNIDRIKSIMVQYRNLYNEICDNFKKYIINYLVDYSMYSTLYSLFKSNFFNESDISYFTEDDDSESNIDFIMALSDL